MIGVEPEEAHDCPTQPERPLDLDPARVMRAERPHYAIIDIGSNSVRLMVYDQLGRAPMPRFNEKSLCRLAEGLAETGAIAPDGFRRTVEATRRFRAIADAMGVAKLDVTATEAIRRASNGPELAAAIAAETGLQVRILSGAEEARYATLGVDLRILSPGRDGRRHGRRQPRSGGGDRRPRRRRPGSACRSARCRSRRCSPTGYAAAKRRDRRDSARRASSRALARPVFYPVGGGWRALAKAHIEAVGAPVKVVHGYALEASVARDFAKIAVAPARRPSSPRRPASRRDGRARCRPRRWCWTGC